MQFIASHRRRAVLLAVAALGRPLFALFAHPSADVREAAARLMRVVALEGESSTCLLSLRMITFYLT